MRKKFAPPPRNVFASTGIKDPAKRDDAETQVDSKTKAEMILALASKYLGQQIQIVNIKNGRLETIDCVNIGSFSKPLPDAACRVWFTHILCGDWRVANADDVKQAEAKDAVIRERNAKRAAIAQGMKTGAFFKETFHAAQAVEKFNRDQATETDSERRLVLLEARLLQAEKELEESKAQKPSKKA